MINRILKSFFASENSSDHLIWLAMASVTLFLTAFFSLLHFLQ